MDETGESTFERAKRDFNKFATGLEHVTWDKLPEGVKNHIKKNPKMTAFQVAMLVVALVPGLVIAPVLGAVGFSSVGPVAGTYIDRSEVWSKADRVVGSAAAAFQSANGATAAFSFFQSAAMGGYAAGAVGGVVTGASTVSAATTGVAQWFKKRGDGKGGAGEVAAGEGQAASREKNDMKL